MRAGSRGVAWFSVVGLVALVAFAASSRHDDWASAFFIALLACAVVASRVSFSLHDRLVIDGSFAVAICAAMTLKPLGALMVVAAGELSAWHLERYRLVVLPSNLFGITAPTVVVAAAMPSLSSLEGVPFYSAAFAAGVLLASGNAVLVAATSSLENGGSPADKLRELGSMAPAVLLSLVGGITAAGVYRGGGVAAAALLLASLMAFAYFTKQALAARESERQLVLIAASRGRLVGRVLDAEERDNRALAEAIHDEAIQNLLVAHQDLREAEQGDIASLTRARVALKRTVEQLRGTVGQLHPAVLSHLGLAPALRQVAREQGQRGGFVTDLDVSVEVEGDAARLCFSVCRELLVNVAKHAEASQAHVSVAKGSGGIVLSVFDNGVGMSREDHRSAINAGHMGLATVRERIEAIGGVFSIETGAEGGTKITAQFPESALSESVPAAWSARNGPPATERPQEPAALR